MYTIMIADDHEQICAGIAALLEETFPQLSLLGSCSCGRDMLTILENQIPDILITDIRMPDINGLDVCKQIREQNQKTQIILISGYKEFNYAKTAVDIGAMAYLVKPYAPRELIGAIQRAINNLDKEYFAGSNAHFRAGVSFLNGTELSSAIIAYVEKNYSDPDLSLGKIAKHFNINYTYASEIFTSETSASLNDFMNEIRISHAKEIIQSSPHINLDTIARRVGYRSASYFGKIFKSRCGMTPSQYKRKLNLL